MREVHIHLEVDATHRPPAGQVVHQYYDRQWEHLPLFQYRCRAADRFIHCCLPVYKDTQTGKTRALQVSFSPPWTRREQSRFTLLYERYVMNLLQLYHNITKVAQQLGVYPQRIANIYHYYTEDAYQSHSVSVCPRVGIDETAAAAASTRKGHDYITAFVDLDTHQILALEDGKGADTIECFFEDHPNPAVVQNISSDMSPAFAKGVQSYFPWARVTYDKWHVFKLQSISRVL